MPNTSAMDMVQSSEATEYTDCLFTEVQDSTNRCPGYDTKQSDGEAPVMLSL